MDRRTAIGFALLASGAACAPEHPTERTASASAIQAQPATPAAQPVSAAIPGGPPSALLAGLPPGTYDQLGLGQMEPGPGELGAAPPFVGASDTTDAGRALDCLTAAIYYEARSEPVDGQRAVAQVVLNRVRNVAFPSSVCGVVYQGSDRPTGCQFTFTCDGSMLRPRDPEAWERSELVARAALAGDVYAPVGAATYYHTTAVSPWWAPSLNRIGQIGQHIFYSIGNGWDRALDFRQQYSGTEPQDMAAAVAQGEAADANIDYVRVAGGTIGVHRGASTMFEGVEIHRGGEVADAASAQPPVAQLGPSDQPAPTPTSSADGIVIHRGTAGASVSSGPASPPPLVATAGVATPALGDDQPNAGVHVHLGSDIANGPAGSL